MNMKLSAVLTDYRDRMQISQRELARRCGLSNSYISFLENEFNPRTGKPIVPTLEQYQKIASGMGMTVHQLFEVLDEDSPVSLHFDVPEVIEEPHTSEARILARGVDRLSPEERRQLLDMARVMFRDIFDKEEDHDA
jgi:transcriptional regulator with XRE-family HTH domain